MAAVAKPVDKDSTAAPTVDAKPKGTSCARSAGLLIEPAAPPSVPSASETAAACKRQQNGDGAQDTDLRNKADRRSTPRRQRRLTQRAPLPAAGDRCRGGLGGHCGRSAVGDIRLAVVVALARGLRGLGGLVATAKSCGGLGSAFGFGRLRRSVAPLPMAPIAGRRPGILCPIGAATGLPGGNRGFRHAPATSAAAEPVPCHSRGRSHSFGSPAHARPRWIDVEEGDG